MIREDNGELHIGGFIDDENLISCAKVQKREMPMHELEALLVDINTVTKKKYL